MMQQFKAQELAKWVRQKTGEFMELSKDLSEETASRAPEGRWGYKKVSPWLHLNNSLRMILDVKSGDCGLDYLTA